MSPRDHRASSARRRQEIRRYLDTGEHDDPLFGAWPGQNVFESATNGTNALVDALLQEVEKRTAGLRLPDVKLPADPVAFVRSRVEPMVRGLFSASEQDIVLGALERSVTFVTPANYAEVLHRVELDTAWTVANFFLASVGAHTIGEKPHNVVELNESTMSYVSTRYFEEGDPFADYIVHESAHVFHNTKRRTVGLPFTRTKEWMLDIDFGHRETFAYCCEAYSKVEEQARSPKERIGLVERHVKKSRPSDKSVDPQEYIDILLEAARTRNGWRAILARCAPRRAINPRASRRKLDNVGYVSLPGIFRSDELVKISEGLSAQMEAGLTMGVQRSRGDVHGSRNLLDFWPAVVEILRKPALSGILRSILGEHCAVVRALFLDKPPGRSWAITWHQDVTIAVQDNTLPSATFSKPTTKSGVHHVEAPVELLERMLIVRIHLDPVTASNGPMVVLPASHREGRITDKDGGDGEELHHQAGDVLLIRPLVLHRSLKSREGIGLRRRVIHLELAPVPGLPDGYRWRWWVPVPTRLME